MEVIFATKHKIMRVATKNIFSWALSILVSLVFVASGIFKLKGDAPEMAQDLGGTSIMQGLGVLELLMVALFLFPRTGVVGVLLMMCYMGGAMAVHLTTGQSIMFQTIIQMLIWLVAAFRFPELRTRLFTGNKTLTPGAAL